MVGVGEAMQPRPAAAVEEEEGEAEGEAETVTAAGVLAAPAALPVAERGEGKAVPRALERAWSTPRQTSTTERCASPTSRERERRSTASRRGRRGRSAACTTRTRTPSRVPAAPT